MGFPQSFRLDQVSNGACYLNMPNANLGADSVKNTKTAPDELSTDAYMVNFDYDADGKLLGIEVVCFD